MCRGAGGDPPGRGPKSPTSALHRVARWIDRPAPRDLWGFSVQMTLAAGAMAASRGTRSQRAARRGRTRPGIGLDGDPHEARGAAEPVGTLGRRAVAAQDRLHAPVGSRSRTRNCRTRAWISLRYCSPGPGMALIVTGDVPINSHTVVARIRVSAESARVVRPASVRGVSRPAASAAASRAAGRTTRAPMYGTWAADLGGTRLFRRLRRRLALLSVRWIGLRTWRTVPPGVVWVHVCWCRRSCRASP